MTSLHLVLYFYTTCAIYIHIQVNLLKVKHIECTHVNTHLYCRSGDCLFI